tara:strand:+ start:1201 stop:1569 length:369 start_codon:yes stop_codon:yes gene_type:complete
MSDSPVIQEEGQLQDYSVDQLAGAVVLVLGAVAGLLQVIWMSKCHCKVNLCYIFRCERRPPTEEEMKSLKDNLKDKKDAKALKDKEDKKDANKDIESLVPKKNTEDNSPKVKIDISENEDLM